MMYVNIIAFENHLSRSSMRKQQSGVFKNLHLQCVPKMVFTREGKAKRSKKYDFSKISMYVLTGPKEKETFTLKNKQSPCRIVYICPISYKLTSLRISSLNFVPGQRGYGSVQARCESWGEDKTFMRGWGKISLSPSLLILLLSQLAQLYIYDVIS